MSEQACIVVGLDGSEGAAAALAVALQLALALDARVVAVHAFEPLELLGEVTPPVDFAALREQVAEQLEQDWATPLREAGVQHTCVVIEDRPVAALLRVAESEGATHIVIGTRGRGGFAGLLLGSVALTLPAAAHVPVTIVPLPV